MFSDDNTPSSPDETVGSEVDQKTPPRFEVTTSRQFESWLASTGAALAVTTYQAGMVLIFSVDPATGRLRVFNRHLERPMGIACDRKRLSIASLTQIVSFVNAQEAEETEPVYVPQVSHFTGDLDVHELAYDAQGRLLFVNTLFSCIATTSETHSFQPVWKPPFITRLAAEDRCHLNGLALRDGEPAYATAVARTDVADGWREHRRDGGILLDIASGEVVGDGMSMPHAPRLHDDQLWLLNAGSGEVGTVDLKSGFFEPVAFCPGFLRGLVFLQGHAIIGASEPRQNRTFGDLALQDRLEREGVTARCGLYIVDAATGDVVHWLRIEGVVSELFDIAVIPDAALPHLVGFKSDEIRRVISVAD